MTVKEVISQPLEASRVLSEKHANYLRSINFYESDNDKDELKCLLNEENWQFRLQVLLGSYKGTLSPDDCIAFEILRHCEQRYDFIDLHKFYPITWGDFGETCYENLRKYGCQLWRRPSIDDVLKNGVCDSRILRSILYLPLDISFGHAAVATDYDIYDPRFLLPLFSGFFKTESLVDCRLFIKTHCLSFVLANLSLRNSTLRKCAYLVLHKFRTYLTSSTVKFAEKSSILNFLTVLRNSIKTSNQRLPTIITIFLSKAASIILDENHKMFQTVNSFILLKPTFDLDDVPEFYKFFHSTSTTVNNKNEFLIERHWILELLRQSFRMKQDYSILKRRFVFKLLLSFFNNEALCDSKSRCLIVAILKSACKLKSVASDLCFEWNLLAWMLSIINRPHMQNLDVDDRALIGHVGELLITIAETLKSGGEKAWNTVKLTWLTCACLFLNKFSKRLNESVSCRVLQNITNEVKELQGQEQSMIKKIL